MYAPSAGLEPCTKGTKPARRSATTPTSIQVQAQLSDGFVVSRRGGARDVTDTFVTVGAQGFMSSQEVSNHASVTWKIQSDVYIRPKQRMSRRRTVLKKPHLYAQCCCRSIPVLEVSTMPSRVRRPRCSLKPSSTAGEHHQVGRLPASPCRSTSPFEVGSPYQGNEQLDYPVPPAQSHLGPGSPYAAHP